MTTTRSDTQKTPPSPSTVPDGWLTAITMIAAVITAATVSTIAVLTSDRAMTEVAPAATIGEEVTA